MKRGLSHYNAIILYAEKTKLRKPGPVLTSHPRVRAATGGGAWAGHTDQGKPRGASGKDADGSLSSCLPLSLQQND